MAAISGQITVATAGTAVQGTATGKYQLFFIRALSTNAGLGYVGNDGADDVTSSNGYELDAGEQIPYEGDLDDLFFDTAENGDKFSWIACGEVVNTFGSGR